MFVYFYLTAELIEANVRMWRAEEEMSEYRIHFDGIQMTNTGELEKEKQTVLSLITIEKTKGIEN